MAAATLSVRRLASASVLGARVLLLEHAGSTSVPGLSAKPIIDIILAVADSADEDSYVAPLEAAGYVLRVREPVWYEHRLLKGTGHRRQRPRLQRRLHRDRSDARLP